MDNETEILIKIPNQKEKTRLTLSEARALFNELSQFFPKEKEYINWPYYPPNDLTVNTKPFEISYEDVICTRSEPGMKNPSQSNIFTC